MMIANGALVQELKLLSDALTPPIIIVQPMPSLLELSLFLMDQGKFPLMSLVSTKNLMSTSIKTDYAPSKMPKSKDFVFVSSRVTSTYIKWPSGVGYYSNFCPSCIVSDQYCRITPTILEIIQARVAKVRFQVPKIPHKCK